MCRINSYFFLENKSGTISSYVTPKGTVIPQFRYNSRIKIMHKTRPLKRRNIHVAVEKALELAMENKGDGK